MCAGAVPLVILANVLSAPPALILGTYFVYTIGGALIIGNYFIDHEDEIPPGPSTGNTGTADSA
jgi:hypothetical protein